MRWCVLRTLSLLPLLLSPASGVQQVGSLCPGQHSCPHMRGMVHGCLECARVCQHYRHMPDRRLTHGRSSTRSTPCFDPRFHSCKLTSLLWPAEVQGDTSEHAGMHSQGRDAAVCKEVAGIAVQADLVFQKASKLLAMDR